MSSHYQIPQTCNFSTLFPQRCDGHPRRSFYPCKLRTIHRQRLSLSSRWALAYISLQHTKAPKAFKVGLILGTAQQTVRKSTALLVPSYDICYEVSLSTVISCSTGGRVVYRVGYCRWVISGQRAHSIAPQPHSSTDLEQFTYQFHPRGMEGHRTVAGCVVLLREQ